MSIDPLLSALIHAEAEDPVHDEMLQKQRDKLLKRDPIRSPHIYYEDTSSTVTGSATSPILYGRCVVCGKPCNSKCSACSSNGTQWMYFCGKEHQMLVSTLCRCPEKERQVEADFFAMKLFQIWPLHKRVCGKRSTPWSWPPLTKKELQEMIDLSVIPCRDHETGGVSTWSEIYKRNMIIHAPRLWAMYRHGNFSKHFAVSQARCMSLKRAGY